MKNFKGFFLWSSKMISFISIILFVVVSVIIFASNRYLNSCVINEVQSQQNRLELRQLGQSLADASDYLTDQVRKYAITGDIQYLYNYWYDVKVSKTRDNIIYQLSEYNLPTQEQQLLEEAKSYSDLLIDTETCSMKLVLLSQNKTAKDYSNNNDLYDFVSYVLDYQLPMLYKDISNEDMSTKAIEILYDDAYNNYKNLIMSPIEEFQSTVNNRLDVEVTMSTNGIETASMIQIVCSILVLFLMAMLLVVIYKFYANPLNEYTNDLKAIDINNTSGVDLTNARVLPKGAYELKSFGKMFNRLSLVLRNELENRKKVEFEIREAKNEADKANHAKSDFLAKMSHELRTPLNVIIGYLYLLQQSKLNDIQQSYCQKINYSSENLLSLISDILDFSKIETGNITFESIDFNLLDLIHQVFGMMDNSIKQKGLKFNINIDSTMPTVVKGDPVKLKQVLINLLGNALKFTSNGEITLDVTLKTTLDDTFHIQFSVIDTGIGIKDEDKYKILEPFVQSDVGITRKYGGTGLGLSISCMIIQEASNGNEHLQIQSKVGKGSCFYFVMYFKQGDVSAILDSSLKSSNIKLDSEKSVLLVDDNEINLSMEKELIETFGVNVCTANSGMNAIEQTKSTKFDMVLMDIRMPNMDGYQTTSKIRDIPNYECVPIIGLTADAVPEVYETAIKFGMNDCATKPLKPLALIELMQKYFNIAMNSPTQLILPNDRIFSKNECLKNLNGNQKLLISLTKKFVTSQENSARYINLHIQSGNIKNASHILHDIIGLSGNLCCYKLYDISKKLNQEIKLNNFSTLEEFNTIWDKTISRLNEYIQDNTNIIGNVEITSQKSFDEVINQFIKLSQDYDISAIDVFNDNINLFKNNLDKNTFLMVKEAIEKYDFSIICATFKR